MTKEEAKGNLIHAIRWNDIPKKEALDMAIQALENIGHLKDRPCSVCEFRKENGCSQWTCVFTDRLFGDMR